MELTDSVIKIINVSKDNIETVIDLLKTSKYWAYGGYTYEESPDFTPEYNAESLNKRKEFFIFIDNDEDYITQVVGNCKNSELLEYFEEHPEIDWWLTKAYAWEFISAGWKEREKERKLNRRDPDYIIPVEDDFKHEHIYKTWEFQVISNTLEAKYGYTKKYNKEIFEDLLKILKYYIDEGILERTEVSTHRIRFSNTRADLYVYTPNRNFHSPNCFFGKSDKIIVKSNGGSKFSLKKIVEELNCKNENN